MHALTLQGPVWLAVPQPSLHCSSSSSQLQQLLLEAQQAASQALPSVQATFHSPKHRAVLAQLDVKRASHISALLDLRHAARVLAGETDPCTADLAGYAYLRLPIQPVTQPCICSDSLTAAMWRPAQALPDATLIER